MREYLPKGNMLDAETFAHRHLFLSWVLGLHLPALFAFGLWRGYGLSHSAVEIVVPGVCLVLARLAKNRRLAAFFVTAGLVFCSSVLVHLSGGTIEAHFHFFILVGLIALYQDWVPFLWNVLFTVLSHGAGSLIAGDLMFNHSAAQSQPWSWALIHGVAVLAACVSEIVFWKNTEQQQHRNTNLAAELATVNAEVDQRESVSQLFVNLARRNQSLLDRQLDLISELEQRERDADQLGDLFQLDHLATRIRRNAESLLVLSGDESPRRWGRPVPLSEVVRAAAAEVEDYRRVEVLVNEHLEVSGRAVADIAHLLAELIENATTFSPPSSEVRVRSHLAAGDYANYVLSIEDVGIGMSDEELADANQKLHDPPEVDLRRSAMLGFHVVGRLARRYKLRVTLAHTPGGGLTALVAMPHDLVGERRNRSVTDEPAHSATASIVRPPLLADQGGVSRARTTGNQPTAALGTAPPAGLGWPSSPLGASAGFGAPALGEGDLPRVPDDAAALDVYGHVNGHNGHDDGAMAGRRNGHDGHDAPHGHEGHELPRRNGHEGRNGHEHAAAPEAPAAHLGNGHGNGDGHPGGNGNGNGHGVPGPEVPPAPQARSNGWHQPPSGPVVLPPPRLAPEAPLPPQGPVGPQGPGGPGGPPAGPPGPVGPVGPPVGDATLPPPVVTGQHVPAPPLPLHGAGPEGLARRVPGAGLAPSLRRGPSRKGPDASPTAARDHERVRSMLSRFQEGQRAGRAAAPDDRPEETR